MTTHRTAVIVVLGALVLAACGGGEPQRPQGRSAMGFVELSAAMAGLNETRAAVLSAQDDLIDGVSGLDDVDEAASAGERAATRDAREAAAATSPKARRALAALPERLTAYRVALDRLVAAAKQVPALDANQQGLLGAVRTTSTMEAVVAEGLRTTGNGAWASYSRLDAASKTWLERSTAGWYRDRKEAAAAFAVLSSDVRRPLAKAREALQRADLARRAAGGRVSTALREADAALAPLRQAG